MMSLLVFKERLKEFYAKFDIYITPVIKFVYSYLAFWLMNRNIGFMAKLTNPLVPLVLALACSFLPYSAISFLAAAFMLAHLWAVSFDIGWLHWLWRCLSWWLHFYTTVSIPVTAAF